MGVGSYTHIPAQSNNQDAWAFAQGEGETFKVAVRLEGESAAESYGFTLDVGAAINLLATLEATLLASPSRRTYNYDA